jgi:DGQHR domain-containing protein
MTILVANSSEKQEKDLTRFLRKLGFEHVDGGANFVLDGRQIDAVAGHETTLLVFECTTQVNDLPKKIDEFRGNSSQKIHALKHHDVYSKYKKHKLIFVVDDQPITDAMQNRAETSKPEIAIWDSKFIAYYSSLQGSIKEYAKYSILAELDVRPDNAEQLQVPAFSVESTGTGRNRLFIFSVLASDLARFCYVARRQVGGENYYQRMIKKTRLTHIARYIDKGMVFPNSIVVALSSNTFSFKKEETTAEFARWQSFGTLTLKDRFDTCWIIDGQHRLFAHTHTNTPGRIIVTAFANISEEKQAEYFLDINREAKKVDSDLLWDLLGSTNPGSIEGIISTAVKSMRALSGGFFEDNINVPSLGTGHFSFNNICSAIKEEQLVAEQIPAKDKVEKNPIWNRQPDITASQMAKSLNQFLVTLDQELTPGSRERLYSNGFVAVLISLYKLLVLHLRKRPSDSDIVPFVEPLARYLNNMSDDGASKMRKGLTSKVGRTDLRNEFVFLLQDTYDKDFALALVRQGTSLAEEVNKLEFQLNKLVNIYLSNKYDENWVFNQSILRSQEEIKRIKELSSRGGTQPWEHLNFMTTVTSFVSSRNYWDDFFGSVFRQSGLATPEEVNVLGRKLWDYRSNKHGHERSKPVIYSKEEELLIKSAYRMFKRAIDTGLEKIVEEPTSELENGEDITESEE